MFLNLNLNFYFILNIVYYFMLNLNQEDAFASDLAVVINNINR